MVFGTSLYDLPRLAVSCCFWIDNFCMFTSQRQKAEAQEATTHTENKKKRKNWSQAELSPFPCLFISFCFGFLYHKLYTSGSFCFFGCCRLRVRSLSARCAHILLIVLFMMLLLLLLQELLLLSGTASSSPSLSQTQLLCQSRHKVVITAICKCQRFRSQPLSHSLSVYAAFKIKLIICADVPSLPLLILFLFVLFELRIMIIVMVIKHTHLEPQTCCWTAFIAYFLAHSKPYKPSCLPAAYPAPLQPSYLCFELWFNTFLEIYFLPCGPIIIIVAIAPCLPGIQLL